MRRLLLLFLVLPAFADDAAVRPELLGRHDDAALYRYADQRVLVVRGAPRQRGRAHGRLLAPEIRANTRAFLEEWAIGRRGRTREELQSIWDRIAPHIPARYHEELAGLAEGSGVPLTDLRLLHAIPSRYHCTGTAAMPSVTRDGKVYHTRSLDYALDIGETVRPQTNSLLLVTVPEDGIAHATVSWAGFLGCVTGMNAAGVSIGEMGSRSGDETYDGLPMIFLVREALRTARSLQQAHDLWRKAPRTCGYNFVVCDGDEVSVVECNRSRVAIFGPGDEAEDRAPHYPIAGIVRRCNHFVDPDLAATQREAYDPRPGGSWTAYERQGEFLKARRGAIDAEAMIELLRGYPATHPCLHQAVMCPTDLRIWVSQARDPAADPLPGAQNQPFLEYDLRALFALTPAPGRRFGTDRSVSETTERGRAEDAPAIEGYFAHDPEPFAWELRPLRSLGGVSIHHLTYPSPGPSRFAENWTVHAEYYRPAGEGPFPAVVVLHILDGRFYVARLVASALAQRGVAALFIQLPYYGDRRPKGPVDLGDLDLPDVVTAVQQGVRDIRRGAAWLRSRPEVAPGRLGITGVSLGSFVAQLAAGAGGDFERCAFVLGGGSLVEACYSGSKDTRKMEALLAQRGWTRERVAAALAPIEPLGVIRGLEGKTILMINCDADEVVPPESTRRYWKALGEPECVWYEGGHYAVKNHVFEVLAKLNEHFARPAAPPR